MTDAELPVTLEDGPRLRFERRYDQPVERVWRALTEPGELSQWFPSGEPLEVTESDEPRLLVGTWFGDELRFELQPDGDGCLLTFTHAFADRDTSARSAAGWDRCFMRLAALFEGKPVGERESLMAWLEVHERYAEEFGVDPELGREAYRQHPLTED
jgi:activator of Hsp90 ATPase-like protein